MAKFKVLVDSLTQRTSKPTDPFTFKRYVKGETVEITDPEEITRLTEAGAIATSQNESGDVAVQEVKPGTDGGAGFSGDVHLTPEQEGEQQLAQMEAAKLAETSKPAKPAKPARS